MNTINPNPMKNLSLLFFFCFFFFQCLKVSAQNNIKILENKDKIIIKKLDILNSTYRETNLSVTPDGQYLFFMSDRGGQSWTGDMINHYKQKAFDGDIWFSKKVNFIWTVPQVINPPINTSSGEDEPVISPDGQTVYFQSWANGWVSKGGPYYQARLNGENWSNIKGLGDSITYFFNKLMVKDNRVATDGMTISPDGNCFLVTYGRIYDAPMDIYMSKKFHGKWSRLKKLALNTNFDERSVFMAADGKTIYFASNGYGGYGGLDIFKTTINENGDNGPVINIGKPFNTEKDDYGFIITAAGDKAYFVRDGDIYSADLTDANPLIKPNATKLVSGTIKDKNGKPISATISLIDKKTNKIISTSKTNSVSSHFLLLSDKTVGDFVFSSVSDKGFVYTAPVKFVNDTLYEDFKSDYVFKNDSMKLLQETITLTVFFDYDKDILKEQYQRTISSMIIENISFDHIKSVEISGFTDGDGSIEYNQDLGLRRAKSVSDYLQKNRLKSNDIKSFGKLKPIASNNSDEGKGVNRRVEIKVVYDYLPL